MITSSRVIAPILLAGLLSACTNDECTLDLSYAALDGAYDLAWRSPGTDCTYTSLGLDKTIEFENGNQLVVITFTDGSFAVGPHTVNVYISDENFNVWESSGTSCSAVVSEYEKVDWVSDDHIRIEGIVGCTGALTGSQDDLIIGNLSFQLYAGQFSF